MAVCAPRAGVAAAAACNRIRAAIGAHSSARRKPPHNAAPLPAVLCFRRDRRAAIVTSLFARGRGVRAGPRGALCPGEGVGRLVRAEVRLFFALPRTVAFRGPPEWPLPRGARLTFRTGALSPAAIAAANCRDRRESFDAGDQCRRRAEDAEGLGDDSFKVFLESGSVSLK